MLTPQKKTHVSCLLCHFHLCSWSLNHWNSHENCGIFISSLHPRCFNCFSTYLATRMTTKNVHGRFKNPGVYLAWSKKKTIPNIPNTNLDLLTHPRRGHLDATGFRRQHFGHVSNKQRNAWNPPHPRKILFSKEAIKVLRHVEIWKKWLLPLPGEVER